MGKITDALKKAADDRVEHMEKVNRIKRHDSYVVRQMEDSKIDPRIISYFDPKATVSEQYKILRTNVLSLSKKDKPHKALVITSSNRGEGKTITTINLAISMIRSRANMKILVIDADMRRGRVDKYLGLDQEIGLAQVLSGDAAVEEALFSIDVPNLTFMAAGQIPENPVELLASRNMSQLISTLRKEYDLILIDTPPVIPVTDASIISDMADGVLMVIQAGKTQRGLVKRAEELLYQAHAKILGHVLTNIEYHLPEYIYRYL
ncbi:MAG: CpsD/CapB family tyrosine-protein kinase [Candidatus Omnitrophota bacterium]